VGGPSRPVGLTVSRRRSGARDGSTGLALAITVTRGGELALATDDH